MNDSIISFAQVLATIADAAYELGQVCGVILVGFVIYCICTGMNEKK
jgi:hypothetical protein